MRLMFLIAMMCFWCNGCAIVDGGVELTKTIWGSTTRALEEARAQAITKTYDKSYWDCMRATLEVVKQQDYKVFKKDEVRGYVVLMGIRGSVNTTEVGVFFVELNDHQTRIELSSLSTNAKRIVAKALFGGLDKAFGLVEPALEKVDISSGQEIKTP